MSTTTETKPSTQRVISIRAPFGKTSIALPEGFKLVLAEYLTYGYPAPVHLLFIADPKSPKHSFDFHILNPDEEENQTTGAYRHILSFATTPQRYSHVFVKALAQ